MSDHPEKIEITWADVDKVGDSPTTPPRAGYPGASAPPVGGQKSYGRVSTNPGGTLSPVNQGPIYMRAWFYLGLAGFAGAFLAWAICEPSFVEGPSSQEKWGNLTMFPLMAILMSLGFGVAEGIIEQSPQKVALRGIMSLLIGSILGIAFNYGANIVYNIMLEITREMGVKNQENPIFWMARATAWAVFGIVGGVVYGLVGQSGKKCLYGVMGGILGAGIGGLAFDPIALLFRAGGPSRAFGMVVLGTATGIAMGLVESALKNRWLFVTAGPLAGKQFILYKQRTTLGSLQGCDVYLFKDPNILPSHAFIELRGNKLWLSSLGGTMINGQAVQQRALSHGDLVQIGRYSFCYQEKVR